MRPDHPLLAAGAFDFGRIRDFTVLMPTRGSVIRPLVERFLIAHGIGDLPIAVETVSDAFGRGLLRQSHAIWIISEGVVAPDRDAGNIVTLPDAIRPETPRHQYGLTTRAPRRCRPRRFTLLSRSVRETVTALGL